MKATTLLEAQHGKMASLFHKLESGAPNTPSILIELANNLAAHMAIEQDIFYPAARQVDDETIDESYEQHALAEVALKRLLATDPSAHGFRARLAALKNLIDHHVQEEEEELFPAVEDLIGAEELEHLGRIMQQQFDEIVAAGFEASIPKGWGKTSADVSKKAASKKIGKDLRNPPLETREHEHAPTR